MFGTRLGRLLHGVGLPLGVTLAGNYGVSCDGDGGSLDP